MPSLNADQRALLELFQERADWVPIAEALKLLRDRGLSAAQAQYDLRALFLAGAVERRQVHREVVNGTQPSYDYRFVRWVEGCTYAQESRGPRAPRPPPPRDPRRDPWPGDILDDDPPAPPLVVWEHADFPDKVGAARYGHGEGHPESCQCKACACTFTGSWPIEAWRKEMKRARVLYAAPELRRLDPHIAERARVWLAERREKLKASAPGRGRR